MTRQPRLRVQAPGTATPGQIFNLTSATIIGDHVASAQRQITIQTSGGTDLKKVSTGFSSTNGNVYLIDPEGDGSGTGWWTVSLTSLDPIASTFTDVIDVLPYVGDGRGTAFSGSHPVTEVTAPAGATVYYTSADPARSWPTRPMRPMVTSTPRRPCGRPPSRPM